jgi:excinuclease UvrABC helicase subunit UvrB
MNKDLARKLVRVIAENFSQQEIETMIGEINLLRDGIDLLNICTMAQMQKNLKTYEPPEGEKGV